MNLAGQSLRLIFTRLPKEISSYRAEYTIRVRVGQKYRGEKEEKEGAFCIACSFQTRWFQSSCLSAVASFARILPFCWKRRWIHRARIVCFTLVSLTNLLWKSFIFIKVFCKIIGKYPVLIFWKKNQLKSCEIELQLS